MALIGTTGYIKIAAILLIFFILTFYFKFSFFISLLLLIGGLIGYVYFKPKHRPTSRGIQTQAEMKDDEIIALSKKLEENNLQSQKEALSKLESLPRERLAQVIPSLSKALSFHNETLIDPLLDFILNLCHEKENRKKIVEQALQDLIYYLSSSHTGDAKLRTKCLKVLVNLTNEEECEEVFREHGGIPGILDVIKNEKDKDVVLQAVRLLVNLSFNEKNRTIIAKDKEVLQKFSLFLQEFRDKVNDSDDEEEENEEEEESNKQIMIRIVRIIGALAQTEDANVYKNIATPTNAANLMDILDYEEDDSEVKKFVIYTIYTILKQGEDKKFDETLKAFVDELKKEANADAVTIIVQVDQKKKNERLASMASFVLKFLK